MTSDDDLRLRVFDWLAEQVELHGQTLSWKRLTTGVTVGERRIPLLSQRGIWKPAIFELPLSITTSPNNPYGDAFSEDNVLSYRYLGTDPSHRDNVGLREAMRRKTPLVYLHGVMKGRYVPAWPVFIVGDDPARHTFSVAVDDATAWRQGLAASESSGTVADDATARRAYVTTTVRRRLHQTAFRERVLDAYREQCAFCRLRHVSLLDAAHIDADASSEGEPRVSNGLALCKLHHAAFDGFFLTVRPDYRIEVHASIMDEEDGPMLKHGLQGLHESRIQLPRSATMRPDPERLARRYERFREARAG